VLKDWLDKVQNQAPLDTKVLKNKVLAKLKEIYDPEIPVNIYDLGLIYRLEVDAAGIVEIDMTLTSPACPVAQTFPGTVENAVREVDEVTAVHVELVWDPPWCQDLLSDEVKLELGLL
jgi:FeS assembly SUF system protein